MESGLVINNLNFKPGDNIRVRGEVELNAKSFALNLGKDVHNLCLHFNPRFHVAGAMKTIVCNSKHDGTWATEHRESDFPFQPGTVTEVSISFDRLNFTIKLPDEYTFKFPNRLDMEVINFMAIEGDFKVKGLTFE
ncbi:galectin-1 [Rhynchonycteris naso]